MLHVALKLFPSIYQHLHPFSSEEPQGCIHLLIEPYFFSFKMSWNIHHALTSSSLFSLFLSSFFSCFPFLSLLTMQLCITCSCSVEGCGPWLRWPASQYLPKKPYVYICWGKPFLPTLSRLRLWLGFSNSIFDCNRLSRGGRVIRVLQLLFLLHIQVIITNLCPNFSHSFALRLQTLLVFLSI